MADKEERKLEAEKHSALMRGALGKETQASIEATVIYEEGRGRALDIPDAPFDATETMVTTAFIPEAMYRFASGKTVLVDPAAFTRPGGAYLDGAFGPEQVICSQSNLYQILCGLKEEYHDKNRDYRRGQLFTDRAAYVPGVVFPQGGAMHTADVIVVAEPLRARAIENHRSERECDTALVDRIETVLRIAAAQGCETLICGAFACGRLGYEASQVVDVFKAWFDAHSGAIGRVVFAVPRAHAAAFDAAFARPVVQETPVIEEVSEEDDDAFDLSAIELPEGVTLRA
ncbi:MAG: TIGR02452 family protein [Slackia sp.]|nr:TIGR02452 family protein [Slackia sp.]